MNSSVALYDYLVESPRLKSEEAFVRIPRSKPRRERTVATAKVGGIRQRKNKRCAW